MCQAAETFAAEAAVLLDAEAAVLLAAETDGLPLAAAAGMLVAEAAMLHVAGAAMLLVACRLPFGLFFGQPRGLAWSGQSGGGCRPTARASFGGSRGPE